VKAEIVAIGTELVTGQTLDTNSAWLSRRLAAAGIVVRWHTTLADDVQENVAALRIACQRADLVLITGGLGPTQDDLTRQVLAELAGVPLVLHQPSLDRIQDFFRRRGRSMPERNRLQALHPAGSEVLPNPRGTAPGIWMHIGQVLLVALPGVPGEMMPMFEEQVLPRLRAHAPAGVLLIRKLNCYGAGESAIEERLHDLLQRGRVPEVGITASDATISLRILARAPTLEQAQDLIAPIEAEIRRRLGPLLFGADEEELQHAVARLLHQRQQSLACAESVTGGLVASKLTQVPGISKHFLGGLVAYTDAIKATLLGVPRDLLERYGAVSAPVAEAMARAARDRFGADIAVSTTGYAGPEGGTQSDPVGTVYVGLACAKGVFHRRQVWIGERTDIQSRAAKDALDLVRLYLLGVEPL